MTPSNAPVQPEQRAVCAHGIPASALSSWRDGEMAPTEAERIAAHVADCPASRAHLADYETLIAALRAQPVPYDAARLWTDVRAGEPGARRGARHPRASRRRALSPSNRYLAGLAAAAAVVLLVAGFATIFTHLPGRGLPRQATATASATNGPPRALQLTWTPVHLPVGVDQVKVYSSLGLTFNAGATAYVCVTPRTFDGQPTPGVTGGATQFWITQDRGADWTRQPDPPVGRQDITACSIRVDQFNPSQVLISVTWQRNISTLDEAQAATYTSADGGLTWRRLPDPSSAELYSTATYQGTVYATHGSWDLYPTAPAHPGLVASSDGMRTWHPVDAAISAAGDSVFSFWLRPDTGELLAEALNAASSANPTLWDSADAGAHWTKLTVPDLTQGSPVSFTLSYNFTVAQPVAGHPFAICANTFVLVGPVDANFGKLACSTDGGATWQERTMLLPPASELPGTPNAAGGPQRNEMLFALANSGAVLGTMNFSHNLLYRLSPGRAEWQSLGALPSDDFTPQYSPDPGGDVLWALPAVERAPNFGTSYSFYDSHGVVYVASYPPER